jgi:hypothetical protein
MAHTRPPIININVQTFVATSTRRLHFDLDGIDVKCLLTDIDSLLHFGVSCKSLSRRVLPKGPRGMEITGTDFETVRECDP